MSTSSKVPLSGAKLVKLQAKAKSLKARSKQLHKDLRTTYVKAVGEVDQHEAGKIRQSINALAS